MTLAVAKAHEFIIADAAAPLPDALRLCVAALGNFDGVHRGHKGVIARALALARRLGRPCAVLTFEPHPADFFGRGPVIFRLTPAAAKARALERLGLDGMIVAGFDAGLAGLSAEQFIKDVLVGRLAVSAIVAGYDFHFGARRQGTPEFLKAEGGRLGFGVEVVDKIAADAAGSLDAVSSTAIRAALEAGDVFRARELLGHDYFVLGEVAHGQKLGRKLGFPTANIRLDPSCRLAHGIYAVRMTVDGVTHDGVASFGRRPTFDNGAPLLEVFVFDFDGDLYGKAAEVAFIGWIRGEAKFAAADALTAEMRRDAAAARAMLSPRGM